MKLLWQIDDSDIRKVKSFYNVHKDSAFVINRINRNINRNAPSYSNELFWEAMISCLITTQQRSGPNSYVTKFITNKPFPLSYSLCKNAINLKTLIEETLSKFSLRRNKTIGEEVDSNFMYLENGGWTVINRLAEELINDQNKETERRSAEIIMKHLKGFGPKQSRNLLQSLSFTKYEIPVDSRIIKWLTIFGFPLELSGGALSDKNYYNLVLDGFQKICEASGIYPCLLDAAIFSSFDEEWPEDKLIW